MDANKIIEKLRGESGKGKYTLYLSIDNMEAFKEACRPFKPSRVIDSLIKDFVENKKDRPANIRSKRKIKKT